jgi:hypothetical protein
MVTRLLRALDAAVTAFVNEVWPYEILTPLDDFDEHAADEYLRGDCGLGALDEPPLTDLEIGEVRRVLLAQNFVPPTSAAGDARTAPRPPVEDTPRVAAVPPAGDTGRSSFHPF